MGSAPPLVSISTFESNSPVSIFTDATCAMCIVSCCRPIHRGVCWTTLVGVMSTCVGNRRLPALIRLARKTSPSAKGRFLRQITNTRPIATRAAAPSVHTSQSGIRDLDVKLFHTPQRSLLLPHRAPGSPAHSREQFLSGQPIRYYRPTGSADLRRLIDEGFQAFNAGRLSEACKIFADKMLDSADNTTIGLTIAGAMTPAG